MLRFVERGVGVKLRIARGELREQPGEVGFVHARILQQAKDGLRVPDAPPGEGGPGARGERMKDGGVEDARGEMAGGQAQVQPERIEGQAQALEAELARISHQEAEHGRMQVQVQMAVDVVEGQTGGVELLKLGVNFPSQWLAQTALEEIAEAGAHRVVAEFPFRIHQSWNVFGRQG